MWQDENGVGHYYKHPDHPYSEDHEVIGEILARRLLTDLKFPTDRIDRICHLIRHHMFPTFSSAGGARKFINKVGDDNVDDLLKLRQADIGGKGMHDIGYVPLMQQYVNAVRDAGEATNRSQLAINGNDLIQAGFKPGPEMGALIDYLTGLVLDDPSLNTKETLLQLAQETQPEGMSHVGNILDPSRLTFKVTEYNYEDPDQFSDDIDHVGTPNGISVEAFDGDRWIGHLTVDDHQVIRKVWVESDFRRMGVATAMLEHLRALGISPEHNQGEMTPEGEAWAERVGSAKYPYPRRKGCFPGETVTINGAYGYKYVFRWEEDLH